MDRLAGRQADSSEFYWDLATTNMFSTKHFDFDKLVV